MKETWIWLPKSFYPNNQITRFDALSDNSNETYVVAEFKKEYLFDRQITCVSIRFSADTEVQFEVFFFFILICTQICDIMLQIQFYQN